MISSGTTGAADAGGRLLLLVDGALNLLDVDRTLALAVLHQLRGDLGDLARAVGAGGSFFSGGLICRCGGGVATR